MPSDMIHPFPVRRKERYVTMHGPVRIFSLQGDIPAFHRVFLQKKTEYLCGKIREVCWYCTRFPVFPRL